MLPSNLFVLAPCLLAGNVAALPKLFPRADGADCGRITETVTVTRTVQGSDPQTISPQASAGSTSALTEQYRPVGTLSSINSDDDTPGLEVTQTQPAGVQNGGSQASPTPTSSVAGNFDPDVVQSSARPAGTGSSQAPYSNSSTVGTKPSQYKNVLYFTNWYGSESVISLFHLS
jgi:hypothetical protein